MKMNNKGFSLVELIVVIAIMAILVGVLAPSVIGQVEKSRYSKDIQALDSLASALATSLTEEMTKSGSVAAVGAVNTYSCPTLAAASADPQWVQDAFTSCDTTINMGSTTFASQTITVTVTSDWRIDLEYTDSDGNTQHIRK